MRHTPFDPIAPLAAELHDDAHRGDACQSDGATCPAAVSLAIELRERVGRAGLVMAPRTVIDWATRMLDAGDHEGVTERVPSPSATESERRSREYVWIRLTHAAAPPSRLGPFERWLGELVLGDLALTHGSDVVGAIIEPEEPWIEELLGSLPG